MYLVFTVETKDKPEVLYPRFFDTYEEAVNFHNQCMDDIAISNSPYEWSYIVKLDRK